MDLLEPMRRAAELGCKDFMVVDSNKVGFLNGNNCWTSLPAQTPWPDSTARINRYAANRCECWWREREFMADDVDVSRMIDLCRAFANEHGK